MKKYKMDLHIHTPASKCYKGAKNDDEYLKIIESAKEQGLDIIAITDHNTVYGYERLMQLKDEVYQKISLLEIYQNESVRMKEEFEGLLKTKERFDNILILPGVEITLNPGIHILVIGDIGNVILLSELLDEIGYTADRMGVDNDNVIDIDIVQFLKNEKLSKLIVSAPHIDSKNGIYNELSGHYRSAVMKSGVITSFSVNSDVQKENIIRLFTTDPEYKRENLPAFINCSDAHEASMVGNKYSFVELEEKTYSALANLLEKSTNKITDTDDNRIIQTIELIEENENILLIGKVNEEKDEIAKILCAALNEDKTALVYGVDDDLKLIGVNNNDSFFEDKLDAALDMVTSSSKSLGVSKKLYKLGNGKYVVILLIKYHESGLWYLKDGNKVYHWEGMKAKESKIADIERIVYRKTINELLKIEEKDEKRLLQANIQMNSTKSRINKMQAIKLIKSNCLPLLEYCELDICEKSNLSDEELERIPLNGSENGNVYYIFKNTIRLNDAILRFSCPSAYLSEDIVEHVKKYPVKKDSIVIVKGGGAHYILKDGEIFGVNEDFLILSAKENVNINMTDLFAWLKSSLFAWYISREFDSLDMYLPYVMTNVGFAFENETSDATLSTIVEDVVNAEYEFLNNYNEQERKCESGCSECSDNCILTEMIKTHNVSIEKKILELDDVILEIFGIDESSKEWISEDLIAENIFDIYTE